MSIPVIDVSDPERPETCRAIDAACREWGFFQAVGHGVEPRLVGDAAAADARLLRSACSTRSRQDSARTAENPWGFYDRELTRHTPDWKQIYDVGPPEGGVIVPQWPKGLPAFKPAIEQFYDGVQRAGAAYSRAPSP